MAAVTEFYYAAAPTLVQLFIENQDIIAYGTRFLRAMCLASCFLFTDFLAVGVFQSLGMGRNALIFAVLRKVVLEIPLLILMNALMPLYGLPYAQVITEMVLAAAAVVMLARIFRRSPDVRLEK